MKIGARGPANSPDQSPLSIPLHRFPLRNQVEQSNEKRNRDIKGATHNYTAVDAGLVDPEMRVKLLANMMAPPRLSLKLETQVMLIKNVDETLVNGSVGKVIGFYDQSMWAKVQMGMTILEAEQELKEEEKKAAAAKKKAVTSSAGQPQYPAVRFVVPGGTYRDVLVVSETWKVELPSGEVQASRSQVSLVHSLDPFECMILFSCDHQLTCVSYFFPLKLPLILAWAMSIHKSQGQTLPKVKVDLHSIFEKGTLRHPHYCNESLRLR